MGYEYIYKQEEYRGFNIKIVYDCDGESPRAWDNLGTIYSNSRNYDPDGHSIEEIIDSETGKLDKEFVKNHIMLDIYAYEHSGITISTGRGGQFSDPWDSGLFGIIAVSKKDAIKEFGKKICTKKVRERALKCLSGEVKTLDMWYTGDVYGFQIEDENGDIVDSCYGYFGSQSIDTDMMPECKSIIDAEIERREKAQNERIEKVKVNIIALMGNTFLDGDDAYRVTGDKLFGMPTLEKATSQNRRLREEYYNTIDLSQVPECVLEDMVSVIR